MRSRSRFGFLMRTLPVMAGIGAMISGGCGSSSGGPPPAPTKTLTTIQVTPAVPSVTIGASVQFAAKGTFSDGSTADLTGSAAWSSSDTTEATIGSTGQASGVAIGRPQIVASSGGISGLTRLIVLEGSAAGVPRFAYSASPSDNTISIYTIDAGSGQLRDNGYAMAGAGPSAIAIDPAGKFAYVVNNSDNNVSAFTIDPAAGGLTAVSGSPVAAGSSPNFIGIDPSGSFVYVTNGVSGNISGYAIDRRSGAIAGIAGSPFAGHNGPNALAFDPSGKFAYVTNNSSGNVSAYVIDPVSGALSEITTSPFSAGTGPFAIAIDPAGKVAVVANENSDNVSTYVIDAAKGGLTPAAGSPFTAGSAPVSVAIDASGKYAYVANTSANSISAFSINGTTGVLSPVAGGPFAAGSFPVSVAADASGKFLYASNEGSSSETITGYAIDAATGKLTAMESVRARGQGRTIALSGGSTGVTYTPKHAYVANFGGNNVTAYSVNAATGGLTTVAGSPFAAGSSPPTVTADPSGKFLYAVDAAGGTISAFAVDPASGGLTPVPGSPFAGGTLMLPFSMAVDPTGRFAYVTNNSPSAHTVTGFTIDRTTGALGAITGSPFAAGSAPNLARVEPAGRFVYVTTRFPTTSRDS